MPTDTIFHNKLRKYMFYWSVCQPNVGIASQEADFHAEKSKKNQNIGTTSCLKVDAYEYINRIIYNYLVAHLIQ